VTLKILRGADRNPRDIKLTRATIQVKPAGTQKYWEYWALIGLGDINQRRGDLKGALKSYNDGLAIIEPLGRSYPGNAAPQRDLSV
jgi:hypothetical protein